MSHNEMHELNPEDPEAIRIRRNALARVRGMLSRGWVAIPLTLTGLDIDKAAADAVGSDCYELREENGNRYVRRID